MIESFTNKQHHGFLGHSYVGSWVNLGAGTSNSDLKNTYGEVRLEFHHAKVDTGMQFLGAVIGDYAKSAINTSIFTGKIIGVSSMLYGFIGQNVPSFCNYARSFGQITECPVDQAVLIQKRMFARRGIAQSAEDVEVLQGGLRAHPQRAADLRRAAGPVSAVRPDLRAARPHLLRAPPAGRADPPARRGGRFIAIIDRRTDAPWASFALPDPGQWKAGPLDAHAALPACRRSSRTMRRQLRFEFFEDLWPGLARRARARGLHGRQPPAHPRVRCRQPCPPARGRDLGQAHRGIGLRRPPGPFPPHPGRGIWREPGRGGLRTRAGRHRKVARGAAGRAPRSAALDSAVTSQPVQISVIYSQTIYVCFNCN